MVNLSKRLDLKKRAAAAPVIVAHVTLGERPARLDPKRSPQAKHRALTRRMERRMKIAGRIVGFMFPADGAAIAFAPLSR